MGSCTLLGRIMTLQKPTGDGNTDWTTYPTAFKSDLNLVRGNEIQMRLDYYRSTLKVTYGSHRWHWIEHRKIELMSLKYHSRYTADAIVSPSWTIVLRTAHASMFSRINYSIPSSTTKDEEMAISITATVNTWDKDGRLYPDTLIVKKITTPALPPRSSDKWISFHFGGQLINVSQADISAAMNKV
jgi:hypothetical protein